MKYEVEALHSAMIAVELNQKFSDWISVEDSCKNINATPEEIWNMAKWLVKREQERRSWEDYK